MDPRGYILKRKWRICIQEYVKLLEKKKILRNPKSFGEGIQKMEIAIFLDSQPWLRSRITWGDFKNYQNPGPDLDQLNQNFWALAVL